MGSAQWQLQTRQVQSHQTSIENLSINADTLQEELLINRAQFSHPVLAMSGFQKTNASHDFNPVLRRQNSCSTLVNQGKVSSELPSQQHGRQFARAQAIPLLPRGELDGVRHRLYLNPRCGLDCGRTGTVSSCHSDFVMDFGRD